MLRLLAQLTTTLLITEITPLPPPFTTMEHTLSLEISARSSATTDANKLLYTPLAHKLSYRATRVYHVTVQGDVEAAQAYFRSVVLDEISQVLTQGDTPALTGELFSISYGIKKGALDLEKEAILTNYRGRKALGFDVTDLTITQKIYIFGEASADEKERLSARFAQDICNPAIHCWSIN